MLNISDRCESVLTCRHAYLIDHSPLGIFRANETITTEQQQQHSCGLDVCMHVVNCAPTHLPCQCDRCQLLDCGRVTMATTSLCLDMRVWHNPRRHLISSSLQMNLNTGSNSQIDQVPVGKAPGNQE